jgi:hypothetical protein
MLWFLCYIVFEDGEAMGLLEEKQQQLENLEAKVVQHKKQMLACQHQITTLERKKRTRALILAGTLFEEAGILYNYDHDEALEVLKKLKRDDSDEPGRKIEKTDSAAP